MPILVITCGGTIGGVAHENSNRGAYAKQNIVADYLRECFPEHKFRLIELCNLDSTDITYAHIAKMAKLINSYHHQRVVIIHGTDTALVTARQLSKLVEDKKKDIRITGAFSPITHAQSDGHANLAKCFNRQSRTGVSLVFDGQFFDPRHTDKQFRCYDVTDSRGRFFKTAAKHKPYIYYRQYGPALSQRTASKTTYHL